MVDVKRPVPPVAVPTTVPAQKFVVALEKQGMDAAAAVVRTTAGLPPKPRTRDEDFVDTLHALVDAGGTVGFNSDDVAESARWEALANGEQAPGGHSYRVKRQHAKRFEVSLT